MFNPGDPITYSFNEIRRYYQAGLDGLQTELIPSTLTGTFVRYAGDAQFMCVVSLDIDGVPTEQTVPVSQIS